MRDPYDLQITDPSDCTQWKHLLLVGSISFISTQIQPILIRILLISIQLFILTKNIHIHQTPSQKKKNAHDSKSIYIQQQPTPSSSHSFHTGSDKLIMNHISFLQGDNIYLFMLSSKMDFKLSIPLEPDIFTAPRE